MNLNLSQKIYSSLFKIDLKYNYFTPQLNKKNTNLFVISHLGQLVQIEALIKYENIKNNTLVVVFTKANTKVPETILQRVKKELFDEISLLELPLQPNKVILKKILIMRYNYQKLLDLVSPKNLYILSFTKHYSLLLGYAEKKDINLILVEEGTATYADIDDSLNKYTKVEKRNKKLLKYFFPKDFSSFLNVHKKYQKVFVAFPEQIKNNFSAESYEKFFLHSGQISATESTIKRVEKYNITSNDFIYVNQRYAIENKLFVSEIIKILNIFSTSFNSKVFIKMHPKDRQNLIDEFKQQIIEKNLTDKLVFINEPIFLIEETVYYVKPKGLIGLTSTSLLYSTILSPNTKVYSIGDIFLNNLPFNQKNQNGINTILEHLDILKKFKDIQFITKELDITQKNSTSQITTINKQTIEDYESQINEALEQNKEIKALAILEWAYQEYPKTLSLNLIKIYLELILKKNNINITLALTQEILEDINSNRFIDNSNYDDVMNILQIAIDEVSFYLIEQEYLTESYQFLSNIISIFFKINSNIKQAKKTNSYFEFINQNIIEIQNYENKNFVSSFLENFANLLIKENKSKLAFQYLKESIKLTGNTIVKTLYLKYLDESIKNKEISDFLINNFINLKFLSTNELLTNEKIKSLNIENTINNLKSKLTFKELFILRPEVIFAKYLRLTNNFQKAKELLPFLENSYKNIKEARFEVSNIYFEMSSYEDFIENMLLVKDIKELSFDEVIKLIKAYSKIKKTDIEFEYIQFCLRNFTPNEEIIYLLFDFYKRTKNFEEILNFPFDTTQFKFEYNSSLYEHYINELDYKQAYDILKKELSNFVKIKDKQHYLQMILIAELNGDTDMMLDFYKKLVLLKSITKKEQETYRKTISTISVIDKK